MDLLLERPFLLYAALAVLTVSLATVRARALAAAGLLLSALGIAADRAGTGGSGAGFATTNEILIAGGAAIVAFAAIRASRERGDGTQPSAGNPARFVPDPLLLGGLLFAGFGPHLIMVAAGVFLALVSAAAAALRSRRPRWIALLVVGGSLLVSGFFLLFTILGTGGGRIGELPQGPFSPPAERLLAILLGLGPLALAGVFPFHRAPWRGSLSPLAAILLARVLVPALPEGLGDWQAPAMLWLAVAVAVDAWSGRWASALVAGGLLGIWSGHAEGVLPGAGFVLFGWLADSPRIPPLAGRGRWSGVWFLVPAIGLPWVVGAALSAQVLVSAFAVIAAVAALGWESRRRARAG